MSVDTSARIVIVGAGPIGLEAALYARYLGYQVTLFEQHTVGGSLLQHGDEILPQRAGENRTSLGLAALRAQHGDFRVFDPNARETARVLVESYFLPLAATDLLAECIREGHTVLHIERTDFPEEETAEQETDESPRADSPDDDLEEYEELEYAPFALLVRQPDGSEITVQAEIVIDASGISNSTPILLESLRIESQSTALGSGDNLTGEEADFQTLEPNFYRLGSKSTPAEDAFAIATGHDQIRRLFATLGGRASLNLYATFNPR